MSKAGCANTATSALTALLKLCAPRKHSSRSHINNYHQQSNISQSPRLKQYSTSCLIHLAAYGPSVVSRLPALWTFNYVHIKNVADRAEAAGDALAIARSLFCPIAHCRGAECMGFTGSPWSCNFETYQPGSRKSMIFLVSSLSHPALRVPWLTCPFWLLREVPTCGFYTVMQMKEMTIPLHIPWVQEAHHPVQLVPNFSSLMGHRRQPGSPTMSH